MSANIAIINGFCDPLRSQAAALYDAAFGSKYAVGIPDPAARIKLFEQAVDPSQALVALSGDQMLGIAGFSNATGSFLSGMTWQRLCAYLGWRGALRAVAALAVLEQSANKNNLLLDGLSVLPATRGRGVGTQLVNRLKEFAAQNGYRKIILNVVDTNPAARRLYERLGFSAISTVELGCLRGLVGFSAATTMEYGIATGGC